MAPGHDMAKYSDSQHKHNSFNYLPPKNFKLSRFISTIKLQQINSLNYLHENQLQESSMLLCFSLNIYSNNAYLKKQKGTFSL